MGCSRFARTRLAAAALAVGCVAAVGGAQARADAPAPPISVTSESGAQAKTWQQASLDDYRKHLLALTTIVEACSKARDTKHCDPMLVGLDDRILLAGSANAEQRLIRYGWLRVLLSKAQETDDPAPKPLAGPQAFPGEINARPPRPSTSQLLKDAEVRLAADLAQTDAAAANPPGHSQERDALGKILAGRDFRGLEQQSRRDTVLEKLGNWINRLFDVMARFGSRSAWIGRVLVWGFLAAVCVGLVWGLMQLERRWRIRLVPEDGGPAAGAASARDWQLWLKDARQAAAQGKWREAVHFVYWASISRLESRRLWPADRARTPREYLALLAPEDFRRPDLATLTGSFERIWYGGRPAGESDYQAAEQLAAGLISGSAASSGGGG